MNSFVLVPFVLIHTHTRTYKALHIVWPRKYTRNFASRNINLYKIEYIFSVTDTVNISLNLYYCYSIGSRMRKLQWIFPHFLSTANNKFAHNILLFSCLIFLSHTLLRSGIFQYSFQIKWHTFFLFGYQFEFSITFFPSLFIQSDCLFCCCLFFCPERMYA